jgi:hypothetical protein
MPLGQALREYAGAANKERLLSLLVAVQRASEMCPWLKAMVDAGEICRLREFGSDLCRKYADLADLDDLGKRKNSKLRGINEGRWTDSVRGQRLFSPQAAQTSVAISHDSLLSALNPAGGPGAAYRLSSAQFWHGAIKLESRRKAR